MSVAIRAAAVLFVAVLTAVAAQVSIPLPFTPVPFTLQPMIVLVGGAALGARLGLASQILYLTAGIAGLPVFAASPVLPQGFLRLLGPTGGFLMAYPLAAFVAGWLGERGFDRRYLTSVVSDGRRAQRDLRVRHRLVRVVRIPGPRRAAEGASTRALSVHWCRHPQDPARRDRAAISLDPDRPLATLTMRRLKASTLTGFSQIFDQVIERFCLSLQP